MLSIFLVSLVSLVGVVVLAIKKEKLESYLLYLVSFSIGTLLGGAFIHLIPESIEVIGESTSVYILLGLLMFFLLEKIIHWRHCHHIADQDHPHSFSYMILIGDGLHNFIDGLLIVSTYMISIPLGISTTIAMVFHEIPQEIGDFGSLLYAGFSKKKALFFNFLSALTAVLGGLVMFVLGQYNDSITSFLVPITAGGFIYIAVADLLPELKEFHNLKHSLLQIISLGVGIMLMFILKSFG